MQVRDNSGVAALNDHTTLVADPNDKGEISLLRKPRRIGEVNSHYHLHANAWRPRNVSSIIAGLRAKTSRGSLAETTATRLDSALRPCGY